MVRARSARLESAVTLVKRPTPAVDESTAIDQRWGPGRRVGRYRILRRLGSGSFGITVLARRSGPSDSRFQKLVALKIMKSEHASDREFSLRMLDEAKLQAALRHDQLVDVYDLHLLEGDVVLEMEYVDGLTLSQYLRTFAGRKVPLSTAVFLAARVLRGIAWMHDACDENQQPLKLVHRDIKPSNIFLSRAGAIKLGDFGLVRGQGRHFETSVAADARILGTPRYMAPEQCETKPVDGRADVYAVGVMLYEMLSAGKHPAGHHLIPSNGHQALCATLSKERTLMRGLVPGLCPRLGGLVDAMVARDPADRPTALAVLTELLEIVPFDGTREELALQRSINTILDQRNHSRSAMVGPTTAADEPTCFRSPDHDDSMAFVATRTVPARRPVRPEEGRTKAPQGTSTIRGPHVALGVSLVLLLSVVVLATLRHV